MSVFSAAEISYLQSQRLARLATAGRDGQPHVVPLAFRYNPETDTIDIGRPQTAFLELARAGELRGRVLDVGCGTGEHALMAAGIGLDATGVDSSPRAIGMEAKAKERGLPARFLVCDALQLGVLGAHF